MKKRDRGKEGKERVEMGFFKERVLGVGRGEIICHCNYEGLKKRDRGKEGKERVEMGFFKERVLGGRTRREREREGDRKRNRERQSEDNLRKRVN